MNKYHEYYAFSSIQKQCKQTRQDAQVVIYISCSWIFISEGMNFLMTKQKSNYYRKRNRSNGKAKQKIVHIHKEDISKALKENQ